MCMPCVGLSRRETQVAELMLQGYRNKQIGAEMNISQKTVESHRRQVMTKTRARSFAQFVQFMVGYGPCYTLQQLIDLARL